MKKLARFPKYVFNAVIDYDFSGMAAEMGFMLMLGLFPAMLFLMAVFGWLGKKSFMKIIMTAQTKTSYHLNLKRNFSWKYYPFGK